VAWRRRMKKCFTFGVWEMIPLAIWWTLGRKGTEEFLRA